LPLPLKPVRAVVMPVWMLQREGAHIAAGAKARLNVIPDLAIRSSTGVRRVRSDDTARPACIRVPVPYQDMSSARTKTKLGRLVFSAAAAVFGIAAIIVIAIAVSAINVAREKSPCGLFMSFLSWFVLPDISQMALIPTAPTVG